MDDLDIAPPETPTLGQQRDALRKGLGRALLWAKSGRLDVDLLCEACLKDWRYDWQVEPSRSPWLWQVIRNCDVVERLRGPIFEGLKGLPEESASQLCGLAKEFAAYGYGEFRERLRDIVRRKPIPSMDWLGERDLIALDGEVGFEIVASVRGDSLEREPWEWTHTSLMSDAIKSWGSERTIRLLETSDMPGCRKFLEAWPGETAKPETAAVDAHRERMRAITVQEVLNAASNKDRCVWFRGWGMNADVENLNTVLEAIRAETDSHRLARLLRVFTGRALPVFDVRVLNLARHDDVDVRNVAIQALERNSHPAVRALALDMIAQPDRVTCALALFINNYAAGDEARILAAVPSVDDDDLHSALMDCEKVLEVNECADPLPLGLLVYRHTPCGHCRCSVAGLLRRRDVLPNWARDELRFDAYEDCRKLVEHEGTVGIPSP